MMTTWVMIYEIYGKAIQIGYAREFHIIYLSKVGRQTILFEYFYVWQPSHRRNRNDKRNEREWANPYFCWISKEVVACGKSAYNQTICVYFLLFFIWHKTMLMDWRPLTIICSYIQHWQPTCTYSNIRLLRWTVRFFVFFLFAFTPIFVVSTWPIISIIAMTRCDCVRTIIHNGLCFSGHE